MNVTIKKISVPSSDNIHNLAGITYIPEGKIVGIIHFVHGMTEHLGRYQRIMNDLASEGYLCVGYDCLGHGYTARDRSELGYIADKNGWDILARDVKIFANEIKKEYGTDIPYYLVGHSMGSFISRISSERYFKPDKLVLLGTGGPNPAAGAGILVISINKLIFGGHHISDFIYKLAFGGFKKKHPDESQNGNWLTTDPEARKKHWDDEIGPFRFTLSAMCDLIKLMKYSNRTMWFKKVPSDLPILLLSGAEDPVGRFGKGIVEVCDKLRKNGKDAKYILYNGARHELINDFTYDAVLYDIIQFLR